MEYITLNNNNKIPVLGLGTYKITSPKEVETAIHSAFESGYRLIDTAGVYFNEEEIGKAINSYDIRRDEIFLTSKVWNNEQGYDSTLRAFENSITKLQTDYLDMYLIHWAVKDKFLDTWRAMEYLYNQGVIKNIGVSNFQKHHLDEIFANSDILPAVNQIELHPYFSQEELRNYCKSKGITVQSWSPIAKGHIINDDTLQKIGKKLNKTTVQVILRWHIQLGLVAIPKSVNPQRIQDSFNVFDFKLTENDIATINLLNKNKRFGPDPDNFNF
jgi:diketogulonate reductase-like aldo/keto reductase